MDRQLLENIKRIYKGIAIYNVIAILIMVIIRKFTLPNVGGIIAGSLVAMVALFLLARNIENVVDHTKGMARALSGFGYLIRLTMYGAILAYAAISKNINIYTVAIGLISTSIVIRVQQLFIMKKKGKEE